MNEPIMDQVGQAPNPLFDGPEALDISQDKAEGRDQSFTWDSDASQMTFGVSGGKAYIRLIFKGDLPDFVKDEDRQKFARTEIGGKPAYAYSIGEAAETQETASAATHEESVRLAEPLEGDGEPVRETELKRVTEYLKSHRVAFYTGAGISLAAGVHDMARLKKTLGVDESQSAEDFLDKALHHPEELMETWEDFVRAMSEGPPTPAHRALTEIAKKLKCKIFTENLDRLHELTGVRAIHVDSAEIRRIIQEEWMRGLDAIVTVGLRTDDNGFLAWYKKLNPKGKIIALNLEQPVYTGGQDYLLKGDLQKTVPELEAALSASA